MLLNGGSHMSAVRKQEEMMAQDGGRRRVVIENIRPEIDAGRFPMKRVVGETVMITADIYADGHEVVATKILYRKPGDREWNTAPMHALENDRWTGTFVVDQAGIYHYRLCAHGTLATEVETWRCDETPKLYRLSLRFLTRCPEMLQFRPEPVATESRRTVAAFDLIRLAAQAACGACTLNHVLGTADLAFLTKVSILQLYMSASLVGVVPAAISVELATGVLDVAKEMRDFGLNRGRGVCRKRNRGNKHAKQCTEQYYFC
jgi:hypothetical protein